MGVNLSAPAPGLPDEAIRAIKLAQASRYISVACLSVSLWEWICMWPLERKHIWTARWTPIKILYLITRFTGIITAAGFVFFFMSDISLHDCQRLMRVVPGVALISTVAAEGILALRALALWSYNIYLAIFFGVLIATEVGLGLYSDLHVLGIHLPEGGTGCVPIADIKYKSSSVLYWAWPVTVDGILWVAMLLKAFLLWREMKDQTRPLVKLLARDGSIYFAVVFIINIINLAVFEQPDEVLNTILSIFVLVGTTIACCRLVLSLRENAEKTVAALNHIPCTSRPYTTTLRHTTAKASALSTAIGFDNTYEMEPVGDKKDLGIKAIHVNMITTQTRDSDQTDADLHIRAKDSSKSINDHNMV